MSHSPYGRNPKTSAEMARTAGELMNKAKAKPEPTKPGDAIGCVPNGLELAPEELAAVFASFSVARLLARALNIASDTQQLFGEMSKAVAKLPDDVKENFTAMFAEAAERFLGERDAAKGRGKAKPADVNPDAGHGAADGFGGTDYPPTMPGPDEGRPQ